MKSYKQLVFVLLLSLPCLAQAHSLQFSTVNWISGFMHPLQGADHIIAMVAVGVWAAQIRNQAVWLLPVTFLIVMCLGGIVGSFGLELPSTESWLLVSSLSLVVLGLTKQAFSNGINALIVAFSAFFHGYAHGYELADKTNFLSYGAGFVTATLMLHIFGILAVLTMQSLQGIRS